ncbi:hypothetical protein CPB83DRAFT_856288 [Crepidotus variabilis]|uniref:Uncharacterized protein n=1 Tax=Crepidotus variabilis TaxID=179855 RepID=A0A9P6EDY1_9AGAR|nr:hypothetical protein CPB83DRAFT_856288 [Crepidotus variabilis]
MSVAFSADTRVHLVSANIPTPPSFSTFQFSTIGQQPKLLSRMSTVVSVQDEDQLDIYGDARAAETRTNGSFSMDASQISTRSRPSLLEALTSEDAPTNELDYTANTSISGFNTLSVSTSSSKASNHPRPLSLPENLLDSSSGISTNNRSTSFSKVMEGAPDATTTPIQANGQDNSHHSMSRSLSPIIFATNDAVPSLETLLSLCSNLSSSLANMIPVDLSHAVSQCLAAKEQCASVLDSARHAHSLSQQALQSAQASMEASRQCIANAEDIQGRVLQSLNAVQNVESVKTWNTSIDTLKKNLLLVEKWARDKANYEDRLRREAEAREAERIRQEEISRQQTSRSTSTPSRSCATEDPPTPLSLRHFPSPDASIGDASMGSVDEETSAAQRELAALQEHALERKRLVEEKLRKQREEEKLLEEEDRQAKEVAAARKAELVRRKAEREMAEEEEKARQEDEEKRRLELEARARAAEAQRKLARERKVVEEKELKEKQAAEVQALKHQQEVARQGQFQTQTQPRRSASQTSTNPRLVPARNPASPTTLTHPSPAIPVATATHANTINIGNLTSQATLTRIQKPPSQGLSKEMPSNKPLSSGSKVPPQDPRLGHKAALSGSNSTPSIGHISQSVVQHQVPPYEKAHISTSSTTFNTPTVTDRRSRGLSRPKVSPIMSITSNNSDTSLRPSAQITTPTTPSPTPSDDQQMSLRNHGQDFGNLGLVLNAKVPSLSPEAQKANLRRVLETSRAKAEESEEKVKVEPEDLGPKRNLGQPHRRVFSGGAKFGIPQTIPKTEVESPVMPSLPGLPQEFDPTPTPGPAMQSNGSNRNQSQLEQRTSAPVQRQALGSASSHPPLPTRQGQRTKDPRVQSALNNTSTSKPGQADQRTVHVFVPAPLEPPTPAMKRSSQTSDASNAHRSSTSLAVSTSQPQGQRSPNMSMQEGMGPDPMTTGGWSQLAPSSSQDEDLSNDRRQPLRSPAITHSRQYDHYSPPPERAVPITRRPSNDWRIVGDHYSPPPRARARSKDPSSLYRGGRSPPPMSRVLSSGDQPAPPLPAQGMGGRSKSPGLHSRIGETRSPRPYDFARPISRDDPPPLAGRKRLRDDELVAAPLSRRPRYSNEGINDINPPYNEDWSGVAVYNPSPPPPDVTPLAKRMAPTPAPPEPNERHGSLSNPYVLASDARAPLLARMDPTPEPGEVLTDGTYRQTKANNYRPLYAKGDRSTGPSRPKSAGHHISPPSQHYQPEHSQNRPPTLLSRFDFIETNSTENINNQATHPPANNHYNRGGHSRGSSAHPRGRGRGNHRGGGAGSADRFSGNNALLNRLQDV